ncbi:MAG: hypothetical protein U0790_13535 [Isosphaeraceae bacterium]
MRARLGPANDLVDDPRGSRRSMAVGGGAIAMVLIAVALRVISPTVAGAGKLPARALAEKAIVSLPAPDEPVAFVRTVLGLTEDVWKEQFRALRSGVHRAAAGPL